eukprot:m.25348 g.25348  ORF g.25348 m.25348 type:complete len:424 (+) comp7698_c0_seq2:154-1425(+)
MASLVRHSSSLRKVTPEVVSCVQRLLADRQYEMEFHGFLTNHAKHAVIALAGLGASPARIEEYWNSYTSETPYGIRLDPSSTPKDSVVINQDNWIDYVGKKKHFEDMRSFFSAEHSRLGTQETLRQYAPTLLPGSMGALTHAIIHVGWALDAQHTDMTVEGLTYLAYTFVDIHPERFQKTSAESENKDKSSLQSLVRTASECVEHNMESWTQDVLSAEKYSAAAGFHPELASTGLQFKLAKVMEEGHHVLYDIPLWMESLPLDDVLQQLYRAAVLLYLETTGIPEDPKHGNFFVLHLITSLWGLENVIIELPADQQRLALKVFWVGMKAMLIASGRGLPPPASLEKLSIFENEYDNQTRSTSLPIDMDRDAWSWDNSVSRGMLEVEEHNIKLVYVCRDLWERYDKWTGFRVAAALFTETPHVG